MADQYGFVPFVYKEQPDGTVLVTGKATDSSIDREYQICDPGWLSKAMPKWFREGGNIREQHNPKIAAGVATEYAEKTDGHHISALITDPVTAKKVTTGTLRGFSFGARNGRVEVDKAAAGGRIIAGDIFEVSVVDRPANPNCMFTIAKADSGGELQPVAEPELVEKAEPKYTPTQFAELLKGLGKTPAADVIEKKDYSKDERDAAAKDGSAMKDGSFPIKNAGDLKNAIGLVGKAKDPGAAKAHVVKRARALNLVDKLPDDWNISKALGVIDQVRTLVPGAVLKADGDTAVFDPDTEATDVDQATSAIACIARLIISEAEGLAAGRMEELWDIQLLCQAANSLQCFVGNETYQEAQLMSDTDKAEKATTGTGTEPAEGGSSGNATDTTKTEAADDTGALTKTEFGTLLQDAITKATKPLQDELVLVKGELAKVLGTPQAGGPVRTRTTTQKAVTAKTDGLRHEINLCENAIPNTGGDVQKGYRERLAIAQTELSKLDGAA